MLTLDDHGDAELDEHPHQADDARFLQALLEQQDDEATCRQGRHSSTNARRVEHAPVPRPGHKPEPGHGVADDLFPEGREFLINQVEQLAVLEDQAPARAYGNRVVESPGVVVDDEQSGVGLLQETEAQVR